MSDTILVENIGELLTMVPAPGDPLGRVADGAVLIVDGRVRYAGPAAGLGAVDETVTRFDAEGLLVTPGLVEPHAHLVFAGSRAVEFDLRAQGKSYQEIQAAGGGILSTVNATRAATDEALLARTFAHLGGFLASGVTTCEAKSGYALDVDGELRLLRILREARPYPVRLSPTLLAHVPPPGLSTGERAEFVRHFAATAIPAAARDGLAEALDVYCDAGAFTLDETRTLLEAGRAAGLGLRVHAEQFTRTGAARLAAELGARSVEHLEEIDDGSIAALARAGTVCNLLPGAALTLRLPFPDARRFLDAGCAVALGTDFNPGSSFTENLPLMMSLACMQMGMSCAEAWVAVTVAAARSVGRSDVGQLRFGARGDVVVWHAGDHREVVQHFGAPLAGTVVFEGRVVHD